MIDSAIFSPVPKKKKASLRDEFSSYRMCIGSTILRSLNPGVNT
jgi:hypothetical protein